MDVIIAYNKCDIMGLADGNCLPAASAFQARAKGLGEHAAGRLCSRKSTLPVNGLSKTRDRKEIKRCHMNIIIDGYNLLKQAFGKTSISERERAGFLNLAYEYAVRKKHALIIVYDGGDADRPSIERKGAVTTVYSGYMMSADDQIKAYIDEKLLHDMLIVTTDRQINSYAARAGVPSIDSLDFYKIMKEQKVPETAAGFKRATGELHKLHEEENNYELDLLMQEGSQMLQFKSEDKEKPGKKKAEKYASKHEKQQTDILKKL